MINSIDITWFLPFCIPLFISLILFSLIEIFPSASRYYKELLNKVKILLFKNEKLSAILLKLWNTLQQSTKSLWKFLIKYLALISAQFQRVDLFITNRDATLIGEPINYFSLTLRKLFDTSIHTWIVYSAALIMLFYFILTIF